MVILYCSGNMARKKACTVSASRIFLIHSMLRPCSYNSKIQGMDHSYSLKVWPWLCICLSPSNNAKYTGENKKETHTFDFVLLFFKITVVMWWILSDSIKSERERNKIYHLYNRPSLSNTAGRLTGAHEITEKRYKGDLKHIPSEPVEKASDSKLWETACDIPPLSSTSMATMGWQQCVDCCSAHLPSSLVTAIICHWFWAQTKRTLPWGYLWSI